MARSDGRGGNVVNFWEGVDVGSGGSFVLFATAVYVFYRIVKKCLESDD